MALRKLTIDSKSQLDAMAKDSVMVKGTEAAPEVTLLKEGNYYEDLLMNLDGIDLGLSSNYSYDAVNNRLSTLPSGDLCQGGTATANGWRSADIYLPAWAFDDSVGSCWYFYVGGNEVGAKYLPAWIKYDFGLNNGKIIKQYTIQSLKVGYSVGYEPKSWTFKGSNNNVDWNILDTQTDVSWPGDSINKKTFEITNFVTYQYYQLYISAICHGNELHISEIEMMDGPATIVTKAVDTKTVFDDFLIVVKEILNGSSIAYGLSRDNGITWTPITNNIEANLSTQPSGKLLRLKAIIQPGAILDDIKINYPIYPAVGFLVSLPVRINAITLGLLRWVEELPAGTDITFATRTGPTDTPDANWSAWSGELTNPVGSQMTSPANDYIQFRATFTTTDTTKTPRLYRG